MCSTRKPITISQTAPSLGQSPPYDVVGCPHLSFSLQRFPKDHELKFNTHSSRFKTREYGESQTRRARRERERESGTPIRKKMQDPANPKPDPNPAPTPDSSRAPMTTSFPDSTTTPSFRGSYHRRAQSEVHFRIPDDLDLLQDPFDGPSNSFEELGSEDDLFCTYMDIEKLGSKLEDGSSGGQKVENAGGGGAASQAEAGEGSNARPRHRHSSSMDGSLESIEAKKAMAPEKLAELWAVDPKRAKRYSSSSLFRYRNSITLFDAL